MVATAGFSPFGFSTGAASTRMAFGGTQEAARQAIAVQATKRIMELGTGVEHGPPESPWQWRTPEAPARNSA